jgi:FkbM family methyltransferase
MSKNFTGRVVRKIKSILGIEDRRWYQKISYSQTGEDILVDYIFKSRNILAPTYIDIGAFHPYMFSNTAFFYERGSKGINIEPNPDGIKKFLKQRPNDINLNIGVGSTEGNLDYFCMNIATMNTFDEAGANELVQNHGFQIIEKRAVPVETLPAVIKKYAGNVFPDFLSLDVEGLDMSILKQIDFTTNFPKVICVETVEYTSDGTGAKNQELIRFIEDSGYIVYADTLINTIFVNRKFWEKK